jgi:hypothetical protein
MKRLVLGFATNQDPAHLQNFYRSARRCLPVEEADIVIVTNAEQRVDPSLRSADVTLFSTLSGYRPGSQRRLMLWNRLVMRPAARAMANPSVRDRFPELFAAYRSLAETWLHPHISRWLAYDRFLQLDRQYDQVFLSDIRDVVFQRSPFPDTPDDKVCLFSQDIKYGDGSCDSDWYRDAYGERALEEVRGKEALCIGTVLGPANNVARFVHEMASYLLRQPFGRIEQAIFNWLYHTGQFSVPTRVVSNIEGPVATLSKPELLARLRISGSEIRRASDGEVAPVVHMYDRYPETTEAVTRMLATSSQTN